MRIAELEGMEDHQTALQKHVYSSSGSTYSADPELHLRLLQRGIDSPDRGQQRSAAKMRLQVVKRQLPHGVSRFDR